MFSNRRRPLSPIAGSFRTSFSSANSARPSPRRPPSATLHQLVVRDLDDSTASEWNQPTFRIPRPTLALPRPSPRIPSDDLLWWTPDDLPAPLDRPPRVLRSERPLYQITPPPTPPPPSIQYRVVPVPFQRPSPRRLLRRIREKRYIRERSPGLCTTLCSGGFGTIMALLYLLFALALPAAKLVLGILYIDQCSVNDKIPLYMIVSGSAGLAIIILLLLSSTCTYYRSSTIARKCTHKCIVGTIALSRGMQGVLALFLFVWFFIGNFWVFGARYRVRTDLPNDIENYCHPALYWFAFYVLIFTYVAAVFMCIFKFCSNLLCCGACDMWKRAFS